MFWEFNFFLIPGIFFGPPELVTLMRLLIRPSMESPQPPRWAGDSPRPCEYHGVPKGIWGPTALPRLVLHGCCNFAALREKGSPLVFLIIYDLNVVAPYIPTLLLAWFSCFLPTTTLHTLSINNMVGAVVVSCEGFSCQR